LSMRLNVSDRSRSSVLFTNVIFYFIFLETTANTLLPFAINLLQSHGYNLVTMAECLGLQPYAAIGTPQTQTVCFSSFFPGVLSNFHSFIVIINPSCSERLLTNAFHCQQAAWTCDGTPDPGAACQGSQCETGIPPLNGGGSPPPPPPGSHVIHPGASSTTCLTAPTNANGATVVVQPCSSGAACEYDVSVGLI